MSDLIDRQAALDIYDDYNVAVENGELESYRRYRKQMLELPSTQPEQRWIPCSEQMPKEKDAGILKKLGTNRLSDYVIATVEVKGERMTVIIRTHDGVWHWDKKYAFPDYKVVAWMPMPKPWEGAQS